MTAIDKLQSVKTKENMITRRKFFKTTAAGGCLLALPSIQLSCLTPDTSSQKLNNAKEIKADLVIAGGGLGGCAAALSALRLGLTVILTEETDWIGGQLTQQGVPPDEHSWIETHGSTQLYRKFRTGIREYYKRNYSLTKEAGMREFLNPGDGTVSRLCHEPRVALAVLYEMLNPYISSGKLILLLEHKPIAADTDKDRILALKVINIREQECRILTAPYFVDATELGDLLPLAKVEYTSGTESKKETKELHAPETGNPDNQQAFTVCFALGYEAGVDHTIEKPADYEFWRNYVPELTPPWSGRLLNLTYSHPATLQPKTLGFNPTGLSTGDTLNLWNYRRIINKNNFNPDVYKGDVSIINWPQNDYMLGNLDRSEEEFKHHVVKAKQLNLSLIYWLQTEASRPDGGQGWPGLYLPKGIMGTEDGMAKYPYVRESRRIKSLFTILEEHVGKENRLAVSGTSKAADFFDSIGIGYYHIDLHPTTGGDNYIDFPSLPFQIPLGALLPQRVENLLPACKNIGTTHITNGCYRLHPVEWSIGEAVGALVYYASKKDIPPKYFHENKDLLIELQELIRCQGGETHWAE